MSAYDALYQALGTLAGGMQELQRQAARQYKPVVDDILLPQPSCFASCNPLGSPGSSPAPAATLEHGAPRMTPQMSSVKTLRTRSRKIRHIEHTLNRLLDFCGYEPVLRMYKQLCRHYWYIDPVATAYYINAYRAYWDSDAQGGQA